MIRFMSGLSALLLCGAALAAETHGDGAARDLLGRTGQFMFQVHTDPVTNAPVGGFQMSFLSPSANLPVAQVVLPSVTAFTVTARAASFSGRGYIRVRSNTGTFRDIPAAIFVDVQDNATPGTPSNLRDRIRVRAISVLNVMFPTFDGTVTQVDIVITQ